MNEFFDSELVREDMKELEKMQTKLFNDMMHVPFYNKEQRKKHLILMKDFLEKQKLFVFRLSLSDDLEAIEMKERLLDSIEFLGFDKELGFNSFFQILENTINSLEKTLDK
jgi:hypothetical protein